MRRRRLKRLFKRLRELQQQKLTRDELLLKLGAAKKEAGHAYRLVDLHLPAKAQAVTPQTFTFALNRNKLRMVRRREGSYLLRSNLTRAHPARLWQYYIQLTEIEQAFRVCLAKIFMIKSRDDFHFLTLSEADQLCIPVIGHGHRFGHLSKA